MFTAAKSTAVVGEYPFLMLSLYGANTVCISPLHTLYFSTSLSVSTRTPPIPFDQSMNVERIWNIKLQNSCRSCIYFEHCSKKLLKLSRPLSDNSAKFKNQHRVRPRPDSESESPPRQRTRIETRRPNLKGGDRACGDGEGKGRGRGRGRLGSGIRESTWGGGREY